MAEGRLNIPRYCCHTLLAMLASGCASISPEVVDPSGEKSPKPAITVIRSDAFEFEWNTKVRSLRHDFEHCASSAIRRNFPGLHCIPREEFTKVAFQNLPVDSAPTSLSDIRVLLDNPNFRQRLESLNLRYIVYVGGSVEIERSHDWGVVGGAQAAAIVGRSKWEKESKIFAQIIDLQHPSRTTSVEGAPTKGTSWIGGIPPFVVGWKTNSDSRACRIFRKELVTKLRDIRGLESRS